MLLIAGHALLEDVLCLLERVGVEADAVELHVGENLDEWHLDVPEQSLHAFLFEHGLEDVFQLQRDVGILSSVFIDLFRIQVAHVFLMFSFWSDELFDVHGTVVEECLGHEVHVVMQFGLKHIMGEHGVEHRSLDVDAIVAEHLVIVFDILSDLERFCVLIEWFKYVNILQGFFTVCWYCHIIGLVFLHSEAQTDQFCVDRAGRSGFCV